MRRSCFSVLLIALLTLAGLPADRWEPNDNSGDAQTLLNGTFSAFVGRVGDADYYRIDGEAGDWVHIGVVAWSLGSSLDSELTMWRDDTGVQMAHSDDAGGTPDSSITVRLPVTGSYTIRVSDFYGWGGIDYYYVLVIDGFSTGFPSVDPHEPNDSPGLATPITSGGLAGLIQENGDRDWYRIEGTAGQSISIQTFAYDLGWFTDTLLWLIHADGTTVLAHSDNWSPRTLDSFIGLDLPYTGTYYVVVGHRDPNEGGEGFYYEMSVLGFSEPPALDAEFVSDNVPESLQVGESAPISIIVRNLSGVAWSEDDLFRVGEHTSGIRLHLAPGAVVQPGQVGMFSGTYTAPPSTGTVTTQWQMVQDGVAWFGPELTVPIQVNPLMNGGTILTVSPPPSAVAGTSISVTVESQNTGDTVWSESAFIRVAENQSETRLFLSPGVEVPPGETGVFSGSFPVPNQAGQVTTEWQLVQDGVARFGSIVPRAINVVSHHPGDIDGDGQVTSADLSVLVDHLLGRSPLEGEWAARADVNGDGRWDVADLVTLSDLM